ncbi:MlaD family protein [Nocardia sp. SYP-A9097]|uniref:MlaD family protein n=1 Tax=Nocardia sp. SYP-A9097 TaxID=2663237 RepID=UPI002815C0E2|nr:MlaD family protein [Nocardia sp. SYP-A9097]
MGIQQHKTLVSNIALVSCLLAGGSYLLIDVARVRPGGSYSVTVQLDKSGGVQPGNDVTWRGYRVGKVKSVSIIDSGTQVAAVAEIEDKYRIPADTGIAVAALSGVGEQYIDFRPNSEGAPYLKDGQVILFDTERISTPLPVWEALTDTHDLLAQIDPDKMNTILSELDTALSGGPDQLRHLVEGFSLATNGLDNLLPQTTSLIENLQAIAGTSAHAQPDLGTLTRNSGLLIDQVNAANTELRKVLDRAPEQLAVMDALLDRNQDPIQSLLTNMSAMVRAALLRTPALRALFPALVVGTAAMGVPAHDGEFYTIVDVWPRPWCLYKTKSTPQYVVQDDTVFRWTYCENPPPEQQIRGSSNAPRPDIPNNGAQMPTWADPNERTLPPVR